MLLCRGAGKLSLDHVAWQRIRRLGGDVTPAANPHRINEI
jgi:hypothetical protein